MAQKTHHSSPNLESALQGAAEEHGTERSGAVASAVHDDETREVDAANAEPADEFAHTIPTGKYSRTDLLHVTVRGGMRPVVASNIARDEE